MKKKSKNALFLTVFIILLLTALSNTPILNNSTDSFCDTFMYATNEWDDTLKFPPLPGSPPYPYPYPIPDTLLLSK